MRSRATDREKDAVTALFGVLIVGAPMLLGGTLPWTVVAITLWSLLCLLGALFVSRATTTWLPTLALAIGAGALWTSIQACPLPCGVVALIAPESARQTGAVHAALGAGARAAYCTLSRDPGETREQILHGVAISAAFLGVWLLSTSVGRRRVLWLIAASSLAMSVVALLHAAFEADAVFGLYEPIEAGRVILLAPLMNQNTLGAFAALGLPLWIGITYRDDRRAVRNLGYAAVAISAIVAILSLSRGAIMMLAVSIVAMLGILMKRRDAARQRSLSRSSLLRRLGAAAAVTALVTLGTNFAIDQVRHEVQDTDVGKLQLIGRAFLFARDHVWVGVGRGAFSSTFTAVAGNTLRYAYAENFLAQWASEWGAPFTLALCFSIAYTLLHALRSSTSLARLSGATALIAWGAQNLVDLGFELLGLAVVGAALLAAIVAPSHRSAYEPRDDRKRDPRALALALLCGGAAALVWLAPTLTDNQVSSFEQALSHALHDDDRARFRSTLEAAVRLHPSEPNLAVLAATEAVIAHDRAAPRWLNRAMSLAPGWAAPHVLAFEWLMPTGRVSQALLELRAAASVDARSTEGHACRLARTQPALALTAAPRSGSQRLAYLGLLVHCLPYDQPSSPAIDAVMLREAPRFVPSLQHEADRLAWLEKKPEASLQIIEKILGIDQRNGIAHATKIRLLMEQHKPDEALAAATLAARRVTQADLALILAWRMRVQTQRKDVSGVEATASELRRLAGTDETALAASYAVEGEAHRNLGHPGEAFHSYRQAYRIHEDPAYVRAIAEIANSLHDRPHVLWAYMELCKHQPTHGDACKLRDELLRTPEMRPP